MEQEDKSGNQSEGPTTEPTPAPKSPKERLEEVERELSKQEKEVENATRTIQDATKTRDQAQARRKVLEDRKKTLAQLVNKMETIEADLKQRLQAAETVHQDANTYHAELTRYLEARLPDAHREHIESVAIEEDKKIEGLKDEAEALRQAINKAEEAKAQTQEKISQAVSAWEEVQTQLQQRSARVQAATTKVTQMQQAAKVAKQNRQDDEAYFLVRELKDSIQALEQALKEVSAAEAGRELRNALNTHWQATVAGRTKLAKAQDELEAKKAQLREKENSLRAAEKERTATIQRKIKDFPPETQKA